MAYDNIRPTPLVKCNATLSDTFRYTFASSQYHSEIDIEISVGG